MAVIMIKNLSEILVLAGILCVGSLLPLGIVSAHTSVEDSNIHVILHTDPGDSPIVQQPAILHFDIKDLHNHLDDTGDCNVRIATSTTLFEQNFPHSVLETGTTTLAVSYIFSAKDAYKVVFSCKSIGEPDKVFTYTLRVDRDTSALNVSTIISSSNHALFHHGAHFFIFGGAFLVGIILTILNSRKEKKQKLSKKQ